MELPDALLEIRRLHATINEKDEEIFQLREASRAISDWPLDFHLTPMQSRILSRLFEGSPNIVSRERLMTYLHGVDSDRASDKTLDVHVYNIRRKIASFGVTIDMRWGCGYSISQASAAILKELIS